MGRTIGREAIGPDPPSGAAEPYFPRLTCPMPGTRRPCILMSPRWSLDLLLASRFGNLTSRTSSRQSPTMHYRISRACSTACHWIVPVGKVAFLMGARCM